MKKSMIALFLTVLMIVAMPTITSRADYVPEADDITITYWGNGFSVESTIIIEEESSPLGSMSTKTGTRRDVYKFYGAEIATVSITASFGYDGSTSWVNSASVSKNVSSGWTYSNENITTSNGTATVTAILKNTPYNINVNTHISCSPNGVIS